MLNLNPFSLYYVQSCKLLPNTTFIRSSSALSQIINSLLVLQHASMQISLQIKIRFTTGKKIITLSQLNEKQFFIFKSINWYKIYL